MAEISLLVTKASLEHAGSTGANQRQIAIRAASPDLASRLAHVNRHNRVELVLGDCVPLVIGDTGAVWRAHNTENQEDFDSLFELLARRPGVPMKFVCELYPSEPVQANSRNPESCLADRFTERRAGHVDVFDFDGVTVVRFHDLNAAVSGCDMEMIEALDGDLKAVAKENPNGVILDFQNNFFVPWAAFEAVLIRMFKILNDRLAMCNVPPNVHEHFRMNQLSSVFHVFDSLEDALGATRDRADVTRTLKIDDHG